LHATLASDGRGKGLYSRGDFIHLGHVATLRVLYPPAGLKRSSGADLALVLQLQVGGARALLMSDSGFFTEQWLLDNEPDLRSDIVIKGQHTKDFSGTASFLARVAPQAVVCSGLGYGKSIDQLDTWEKETSMQGIAVFRQDKAGAVQIDIRDDGFELRGFVNAQTFRSRAR
jgi:beta-lactamase superfamily II metal-dependent hydrolase